MNWLDAIFSPKGTLRPQHFAIIVIAVYLINIAAGSIIEGQFIKRVGPWPYFALQLLLTWIWFAAHAKRLRDAGKGWAVAAALAFIYVAAMVLLLNLISASEASLTESTDPKEPKVSLIGAIFAVLFINTLFTGDPFLIVGLLVLFIGLPLLWSLIVVIYSLVTGLRASMTPEPQPQPQLPAA
jgi:uncharacterized membrane protein YhaH (DUF805 family)